MTIYGYMKTINISTLKAKLSSALKHVRSGNSMVVLDRDIPVAEIIPYQEKSVLRIRVPKNKFTLPKSQLQVPVDPLEYLMDGRMM